MSDKIDAISAALKVERSYLEPIAESLRSEVLDSIAELRGLVEKMQSGKPARPEVPLYASVGATTAPGESNGTAEPLERLPVGYDILDLDPDAFAVRVSGDSMAPEIVEGDVLLCSPAAPVKTGDVVVATTPDGDLVKRVKKRVQGIELQSANVKYPPIRLWENHGVKIVKAIRLCREL
jgi:phage repressor protein C with HTH and peptisase S24 domain